jgi:hypothetical protein
VQFWRQISNSKKVIQTILGVKMPFTSEPKQLPNIRPYELSVDERNLVRDEVQWMVEQKIATRVNPQPNQIVSPFFLATNKDLTKRPILNVKEINKRNLPRLHFQMENLAKVLPVIRRNDWFTSWDVRKGFFNIVIHPDFRHYFCFEFEGQRYQYTCLVMGLSIAPLFFSKLMAVLVHLAQSWGIQVSYYLDDTLICAPNPRSSTCDTQDFGSLLQAAGFLLHAKKSVQKPAHVIEYLGFVIDSRSMTVALPVLKRQRITNALQRAIKNLRARRKTTSWEAARVIGLLVLATLATRYGKAHYRTLEQAKLCALQEAGFEFNASIVWPKDCLDDLKWWLAKIPTCSTSFLEPQPTTTIVADASLEGWGAIWQQDRIYGGWENEEPWINELELLAVLSALQSFLVTLEHQVIRVCCNNTVAVAYINHMGGRIPQLDRIAQKIWHLLILNLILSKNLFLTASWVDGRCSTRLSGTRCTRP